MAEEIQASQGDSGQGAAQAAQPTGADAGQGAAQADQGQQQQAQDFAPIPFRQFENLGYGRDFNKVIHTAKEYQDFSRDGFVDATQFARQAGLTGYDVQAIIAAVTRAEENGQDPEAAARQAIRAKGGTATPQAIQGAVSAATGQSNQTFDPAQVEKMVQQAVAAELSKHTQQQRLESERQREAQAYDAALKSVGLERKPQEVQWGGVARKVDPMADYMIKPAIAFRVAEIMAERVNPRDPQYQQKVSAPAPQEVIDQAVRELTPFIKGIRAMGPGEQAGQQAALPATTLPAGGAGGRGQANPADLSPEELQAETKRRANIRLAAMGAPQIK